MILEFNKQVNPIIFIEEIKAVEEKASLTTHGLLLKIAVPNDISKTRITQIGNLVKDHVFVKEVDRRKLVDQAFENEFNSATTVTQLKDVLKKKFGWGSD